MAHFHAYYQDYAAVFSIGPVELLAGTIPQRQQRLVEAWAELHQEELLADWELLRNGVTGGGGASYVPDGSPPGYGTVFMNGVGCA